MNKSRKGASRPTASTPGRAPARQSNGRPTETGSSPDRGAPVKSGRATPHTVVIQLPPGILVDDVHDVVLLETVRLDD